MSEHVRDWSTEQLSTAFLTSYSPVLPGQVNREREAYQALHEARARIAELEAEIKQLEHFCAKVCEPWQIVEETKAELLIAKRLNAKWMDERTEALIRAERAEKALAGARLMPREKS